MKKEEAKTLSQKSLPELQKLLGDLREKFWTLKSDLARGKVKNIREAKDAQRDIARVLTAMNAPKIQEVSAVGVKSETMPA